MSGITSVSMHSLPDKGAAARLARISSIPTHMLRSEPFSRSLIKVIAGVNVLDYFASSQHDRSQVLLGGSLHIMMRHEGFPQFKQSKVIPKEKQGAFKLRQHALPISSTGVQRIRCVIRTSARSPCHLLPPKPRPLSQI